MNWNFAFFFSSITLGVGLAMDAFSVSLANGLNEPKMKKDRMCAIAGVFSAFQFLMPILGWACVHTILQYFTIFEKFIPWAAFILLSFIGGKMLLDGFRGDGEEEKPAVGFGALMVQGIATSIDALSVGFTVADYDWLSAVVCCLLIGGVTFVICLGGLLLGRRFGTKLAGRAAIMGGTILILIGLKILLSGILHC